ncbi:hypothetical protein B0H34DRAFT_669004 [Crassisporium funariophilum]|nr:hypothetical protein B0H34DRAFT_669004 [Crassisporium funariophilum]
MANSSPQATNVVEVGSIGGSKIRHVSLYTGRAEITRVYNVNLKGGDNKVVISGLPTVLVQESVRVEGHGPCTIHEVSFSEAPAPTIVSTSPQLEELLLKKAWVERGMYRCKRSMETLEAFQNGLNVKHVGPTELAKTTGTLESVAAELDEKLIEMEEEQEALTQKIKKEREALGEVKQDDQLKIRASITVFAEKEGEMELVLIYGVTNATWDATYDIYVKMDTKEKAVTLIYKAAITHSTGEDWDDVALTLETATPHFGAGIPELAPWTLSVYQERQMSMKKSKSMTFGRGGGGSDRKKETGSFMDMEEGSMIMADAFHAALRIPKRGLLVSSKGDISATFSIPGLINIPSDGTSHNVTITELSLDAVMSWVCVPKKEPKAHLTANIKNDSEYTFLSGMTSVYVDGSFISRSNIPAVSPQESFDCALGLDPSIRIVYHPRTKKVSRTGITRKSTTYAFDQRLTITNTKSSAIEGFKILEQFPVSNDATIVVNLTNPPLVVPQQNKKGVYSISQPVKIGTQTVAQWKGTDEPETDPNLLGKDGEFSWVCSIPAQGKLNLAMSWEVVSPSGSDIVGLEV